MDGEGSKAFAAFCCYRDLGASRSIEKAWRNVGSSGNRSVFDGWSSDFNWVVRARAYDAHLDSLAREEQRLAVQEMAARHSRLAQMGLEIAEENLLRIKKKMDENKEGTLDVGEMRMLVKDFALLERLTVGEPTEQVAGSVNVQVAELDARAKLESILAEYASRRSEGEVPSESE